MYLVTASEMRRFEAAADAAGLTYDEMMRRAGAAVARAVEEQLDSGSVVVLAGPGNNGGDGLVAARRLHDDGFDTQVFTWKRATKDDPLVAALDERKVTLTPIAGTEHLAVLAGALAEADVVIDGLLGTGASRPITDLLGAILDTLAEAVDETGPLVVAVDVPTGLNVDSGEVDPHTVPADITVTFGFPKIGQSRFPGVEYLGELVIDGLGIPEYADSAAISLTTADEVAASLPERSLDAHKGTFGRVLMVAGSANYTGAAFLAAAAAYRSGCGLVTLALPGSIQPIVASLLPEATFLILSEDLGVIARPAADFVAECWGGYEAVLLGPGLTTERPTREFLSVLLTGEGIHASHDGTAIGFGAGRGADATPGQAPHERPRPKRLVVDADGLNLLAGMKNGPALLPAGSVLTPHPGEMARLTGRDTAAVNADRIGIAQSAAADWGHIVVLKGAFTVIAAPDGRVALNPFADPALATAGTGDVLSGLIAGLLAQGMAPFEAAVAGAYIHGLAGQMAGELVGSRAAMATDVLDGVVEAWREIED